MTKEQIKKYLQQKCNEYEARNLELYIMNDRVWYSTLITNCVEYAKKRLKNKTYDSVLYIQYVYNVVEKISSDQRFRFDYYYKFDEKFNVTKVDKYHVARSIAEYIESDYLNIR